MLRMVGRWAGKLEVAMARDSITVGAGRVVGEKALFGMAAEELRGVVEGLGLQKYRAVQLGDALYKQRVERLEEITTLPVEVRARLAAEGYLVGLPELVQTAKSVDGTERYLVRLADGETVETVWMPGGDGGERGDGSEAAVEEEDEVGDAVDAVELRSHVSEARRGAPALSQNKYGDSDSSSQNDGLREGGLFEGVVDVADEVAEVAAAVEEGDHRVAGGGLGGGVVGVDGQVPLGVEGGEVGVGGGELGVEVGFGGEKFAAELRVVVAHFLGGAHLFELHVELEGLFEEIFGDDLLLGGAGGAGGGGGGGGLLLELDAFELEEVLGAGDGVLEGAVGVVEAGGLGEGVGLG